MPSGTPTTPAFAAGLSPRGAAKDSSSNSRPHTPSPTRASSYQVGAKAMGGLTFADCEFNLLSVENVVLTGAANSGPMGRR
jgi:hypothetical protein